MVAAPVGFQCRRCVKVNTRVSRQTQGPYGGALSPNPRLTSLTLIVVNAAVWLAITVADLTQAPIHLVNYLGLSPGGVCSVASKAGSYWSGVGQANCAQVADGVWVPGVAGGAWWQVLTSLVTHVSIVHIGVNCLSLWFLGPPLESLLGRARFLGTYITSGLVGSLVVCWLSPVHSMSIGGSGSLFGLMGALLVVLWHRKADVRQLLIWLGINLVITFVAAANISWQAHLGGLVGGAVIACAWTFIPSSPNRSRNQWLTMAGLLVIVVAGLAARAVMLS